VVERPRLPIRRLVVGTPGAVALAAGVLQWFFPTSPTSVKLKILVVVTLASAVLVVAPFVVAWISFVRQVISEHALFPERLRQMRVRTWLAVETNALLSEVEISILRLKTEEQSVFFLLNVGTRQGVREDMQFEVVAVPDMEIYGVCRVLEAGEESTWTRLEDGEGRPEFAGQMLTRLQSGDVEPPKGFAVRPLMAGSWAYVAAAFLRQANRAQFENTVGS
jgi:hypothetical protein